MAYIIETPNSFNPAQGMKKHTHPGGITIREWLVFKNPGFVEFPIPTVCAINGKLVRRSEWDHIIKEKDVINFLTIPQGPFLIIAIIIVAVIALSIAFALSMDVPNSGALPASDPVFSNKGQNNEIRLLEPIEVCYGRNRIYPSFAANPYYQYVNNDQFQYSLFCLGQGQYDIEVVQIGDTDIANYEEVTYEVIPPGGTVTLFPANVVTSVEAGGQSLLASNQDGYGADGYVGPFPVCSSGKEVNKIEIDIVWPKGLYNLTSKGKLEAGGTEIQIQARLIDNAGAPLGPFVDLPSPSPIVFTATTTTPQRRTYSFVVSAGRYEVKVRRTDFFNDSVRAGNDVIWEGMRGFLTDAAPDYGNVTLMAVRIRATNNLNNQTQTKFNVIATRKLRKYDSNGYLDEVFTTRSIVWAFVDIFKSTYGGRVADNTFFDWDTLLELDALYTSRGDNFDWIFRDPITVWESAAVIAACGRATPLLIGSLITMKRDQEATIPVTLFNPDNIIKDTFQWDVKLWDLDEFDSINVEYTEVSTGYKQEHVVCTLPGGTTDHPKDLRLSGVQDRDQAYREGLYQAAVMRYLRENITFETGLEGLIITFGDLVAIGHDVPKWGTSGFVINAANQSNGRINIWLSEPVVFGDSGSHQIIFRGSKGETVGPLSAFETEDPQQIEIIDPSSEGTDFLLTGKTEPMIFIFGVAGNVTKYAKVTKIEPVGGERVRITAVNYTAVLYSFDGLTPPPLNQPSIPPAAPDLPTIDNLFVTQMSGVLLMVQVAWTAAFGAQRYVVQTSSDGDNWEERAITTQTAVQLQVQPGDLWVRVAAINNGQGPWTEKDVSIELIASLDNDHPWTDLDWGVRWFQVLNAVGYEVKVYDTSGSDSVLKNTFELTQNQRTIYYDYFQAVIDSNITRDMLLTVDPVFEDGVSGSPISLDLHNNVPSPPTGMASSFITLDSTGTRYHLSWAVPHEDDLVRIKVWLSSTNNFDPSVTVAIFDETHTDIGWAEIETSLNVLIHLDSHAHHPTYYWRVAVFDVWGDEISTNVCAQQTIAAF